MKESYDEHRERDRESIEEFLVFSWLTGWFGWLIPVIILAICAAWVFNVLGESTILNSPDIYYTGINPWTKKQEMVKGCRPEHLDQNNNCKKEITLDLVKKSFPFLGEARDKK